MLCCSERWLHFLNIFFIFYFFLQKTFLSIIEATCVKEPTEPGREIRTSEEKKERVEINLLAITVLKRACFCICVSAVVQRRQFEWRNMSCLRCMYLTGWGNQDHVFEAARNKEGVDYYTLFTSSISWADTFSFISAQRRTCTLDSWTSRAFLSKSGVFFVAKIWDNALDKEFFVVVFVVLFFWGFFLGFFFGMLPDSKFSTHPVWDETCAKWTRSNQVCINELWKERVQFFKMSSLSVDYCIWWILHHFRQAWKLFSTISRKKK